MQVIFVVPIIFLVLGVIVRGQSSVNRMPFDTKRSIRGVEFFFSRPSIVAQGF